MNKTPLYFHFKRRSIIRYLNEIGKIKVITAKDERNLLQRVRQGDVEAFEILVKANLKFVVKIAKSYTGQGLSLEDLINEGNLGLIKAINKYDETRGYKFISYAVWWIKQSIRQALNEQSKLIRMPANKIKDNFKISKAARELESEYGRQPFASEIANRLNMSYEDVISSIDCSAKYVSLAASLTQTEGSVELIDMVNDPNENIPDKHLDLESLKDHIRILLQKLEPTETVVIKLYFGIDLEQPMSLEKIGEKYHLSREAVNQIKEKAIKKLRRVKKIQSFKMYLD